MTDLGKVAVLCTGGGAAGIVQAGELLALADHGIAFDTLHGVSVGALNSAIYLQGNIDKIEELWMTVQNRDIYAHAYWNMFSGSASIYDSRPLRKFIAKHIDEDYHRACGQNFYVTATDIDAEDYYSCSTAEAEDITQLIYASASPPVFFPPVQYGSKKLTFIDGGILNNFLITQAVKTGADTIIVLSPRSLKSPERKEIKNIIDMISLLLLMPSKAIFKREKKFVEILNGVEGFKDIKLVVVEPSADIDIPLLDFNLGSSAKRQALINVGFAAAKAQFSLL